MNNINTGLRAEEIQVYRQNGYIYAKNIGTKKAFSLHGEPLTIEARFESGLVASGRNHPNKWNPWSISKNIHTVKLSDQ